MARVRFQSMSVPEILERYPASLPVFRRFGIEPDGYAALAHESLVATCKVHQLDGDAVAKALEQATAGEA